jgi:hypothetical protein
MIKPLRRYHFVLWRLLAVVMPVLFVSAIWLRPDPGPDYRSVEKDFSFRLHHLSDSTSRIDIDVKNSLRVPSCVVYASVTSQDLLLGQIGQKGTYHFEIENKSHDNVQLRLYDPLHKREITTVLLNDNITQP